MYTVLRLSEQLAAEPACRTVRPLLFRRLFTKGLVIVSPLPPFSLWVWLFWTWLESLSRCQSAWPLYLWKQGLVVLFWGLLPHASTPVESLFQRLWFWHWAITRSWNLHHVNRWSHQLSLPPLIRGLKNRTFGKRCFWKTAKKRRFDENSKHDEFAFYPQNMGVTPWTPPKRQKWRKWQVSPKQKHGLPKAWFSFPDWYCNVTCCNRTMRLSLFNISWPFSCARRPLTLLVSRSVQHISP